MTAQIAEDEARDFHRRWAALKQPQRPNAAIRDAMHALLAERPGPALQLGVTPEIADASAHGVAVDYNPDMIRLAWPGDSETHRALLGNWLALPLDDASVATAFGDGSLTMLRWIEDYRAVMTSLARVFRPGGRLVLRCFVRPDDCETLEELAEATLAGEVPQAGAFKLRLNMATAARDGCVTVSSAEIHEQFEHFFPDRPALAAVTGWTTGDFVHFDAYRGASSLHSYPTRTEIAQTLPAGATHRFVETAGYPLAERCPLLVVDFPGA